MNERVETNSKRVRRVIAERVLAGDKAIVAFRIDGGERVELASVSLWFWTLVASSLVEQGRVVLITE